MRPSLSLLVVCIGILLSGAAMGQTAAPAAPTAATDPATLKLARDVVAASQGDRGALLNGMTAPMVAMMKQHGLTQDQAQVLVQEAVLPSFNAHYDELLDIVAQGYAATLGKDDLRAIAAFYASPAGKHMIAAQPQLTGVLLTGIQQWAATVKPEMLSNVQKAVAAHGWGQPSPH